MAFQLSNTSTYNVENVLRQNIVNSDYYNNTCLALTTWVRTTAVGKCTSKRDKPHTL